MICSYGNISKYKTAIHNFPIHFDKKLLQVFDKASFKIQGDNKESEIEKHCAAFDGMKVYFKQFLLHSDRYEYIFDLEKYSSNKPIFYRNFCSYFRSYVRLKENKNLCMSFIANKDFVAIEAGFQIKDLSDEEKEFFNKTIIAIIKENNLFSLSAFNFDLLYTFIGKKDENVPLGEALAFCKDRDLKDGGIFQFRWKVSRETFEAQDPKLRLEMMNVVDAMIDFLNELEQNMPVIQLFGISHGFQSRTFSLGLIDDDLLLSRQQLIDKHPNILEANHKVIFPHAVEKVKKQLLEFYEGLNLQSYLRLKAPEKYSPNMDWKDNEHMTDKLPLPSVGEITIKNISENDSRYDITFVAYQYEGKACYDFRLKDFSSPLKLNIIDNCEVVEDAWYFIKDIFQDEGKLENTNIECYERFGEHAVYVFQGNDVIYRTNKLPALSYDMWEEKWKVWLDEHAQKITEKILYTIDDILSEECEELV